MTTCSNRFRSCLRLCQAIQESRAGKGSSFMSFVPSRVTDFELGWGMNQACWALKRNFHKKIRLQCAGLVGLCLKIGLGLMGLGSCSGQFKLYSTGRSRHCGQTHPSLRDCLPTKNVLVFLCCYLGLEQKHSTHWVSTFLQISGSIASWSAGGGAKGLYGNRGGENQGEGYFLWGALKL